MCLNIGWLIHEIVTFRRQIGCTFHRSLKWMELYETPEMAQLVCLYVIPRKHKLWTRRKCIVQTIRFYQPLNRVFYVQSLLTSITSGTRRI